MTTKTTLGQPVPDMTLDDDEGDPVNLRELEGHTVVLYFYPKDETSGCTTQACSLRDSWSEFERRRDVLVYGVSPDDVESHAKFRAKHDLPFSLLVDTDHKLADAFGFWVEKTLMGRKYHGVERSTVIIDPQGKVRAVHRKVAPGRHTELLRRELGL